MDDPIFKDGFYIYADGAMIPESSAIEGLSTSYEPCMPDSEKKGEDSSSPSP